MELSLVKNAQFVFVALCMLVAVCKPQSKRLLQVSAANIPDSNFTCHGRVSGYYADVETGCQVYHMCDGRGRQFSYSCPNRTLFQQRMMVCDHWYMVNCSTATEDYGANLLIGRRNTPFVPADYNSGASRKPVPKFVPELVSTTLRSKTEDVVRQNSAAVNDVGRLIRNKSRRLGVKPTSSPDTIRTLISTSFTQNPVALSGSSLILPNGRVNLPQQTTGFSTSFTARPLLRAEQARRFTGQPNKNNAQFTQATTEKSRFTLPSVYSSNPFFSALINNKNNSQNQVNNNVNSINNNSNISGFSQRRNSRNRFQNRGGTTTTSKPTTEAPSLNSTVELQLMDTRRMFFIPDYDVDQHLVENMIVKRIVLDSEQHPGVKKHHRAMKFRTHELHDNRNPACPQCHSEFLRPGQCEPCVIIR